MEIALTAVPEPCALAANGERVLAEIMKDASSSYFGPLLVIRLAAGIACFIHNDPFEFFSLKCRCRVKQVKKKGKRPDRH